MKKLLIIDNYDSFTYNLVQYFAELGVEVLIFRNDEIDEKSAKELKPDFLVFSPGPGTAENDEDLGNGQEIFETFRGKIPILGVCLGHQMIGKIFGGKIITIPPQHGKRWALKILQSKEGIFKNLPEKITAMRYHSMVLERESFPQSLNITCETDDEEGIIMGLENSQEKIFGVQFHPESIGTEFGKKILINFLEQ